MSYNNYVKPVRADTQLIGQYFFITCRKFCINVLVNRYATQFLYGQLIHTEFLIFCKTIIGFYELLKYEELLRKSQRVNNFFTPTIYS